MVTNALEADGRFDHALSKLEMKVGLHKNMLQFDPTQQFPSELLISALPYTIMTMYSPEEKKNLFGTSDNTDTGAIVKAMDGKRVQNPYKKTYRPRDTPRPPTTTNIQTYRKKVDKICKACGTHGHDVYDLGCDFCARFILATKFLSNNPRFEQKILKNYRDVNIQRQQRYAKSSFSTRFNATAMKKNYKIGPTIKALIDIMADTFDDDDNKLIDLEDTDLIEEIDDDDDFHDSAQSPGVDE